MSLLFTSISAILFTASPSACTAQSEWVLVAHGGAGAWDNPPKYKQHMASILRKGLEQGGEMLARGRSAVDVVEAVLVYLEDAPDLNAGRGGIPNREGFVELDAAIMRGSDLAAGAVAGLRVVKNPIRLARRVMEKSPHVMFVDRGAVSFARKQGLDIVEPSYFIVGKRPHVLQKKSKAGTVGAVVLDRCGEVVAGTSTGGYDSKIPGRVGDVPVIGAGTYAHKDTAAISATGWGEWFIRYTAAHDVSSLMAYRGVSVGEALRIVLNKIKKPAGAMGGLIAVTAKGEWATHHTSKGMLRGVVSHRNRRPRVGITGRMR